MIGFMKNVLWALISGPLMIAVALFSVIVMILYIPLGLAALTFFVWALFWGVHFVATHEMQSFWYFLAAFGVASAASAAIVLLSFLIGFGSKETVKGAAKVAHARRNRRAVISIPNVRRHTGPPTLRLVQ